MQTKRHISKMVIFFIWLYFLTHLMQLLTDCCCYLWSCEITHELCNWGEL